MSEQSTPPSSAEASAESFTVKNEGGDSNTNQPPNSVKADPEAVPSTTTSSSKRERSPDGEGGQDKSESASAAKKMKQEDGQAASATSAMDDGRVASSTGSAPPSAGLPATPTAAAAAAASTASSGGASGPVERAKQDINMRALIVTQDASIIIGKGGRHVKEIREQSSARVNVSESIVGNPERILSVQGALDAVSKAFGLIVRRINDEPFDQPSVVGSRPVTIKFIIPNSRMGSVIGKGGSKIKEIQEASGAQLKASEAMLPGSTERVLSVTGVADAVHIAVYYIGVTLLEYQDRGGGGSGGGMGGGGAASTLGQYRPSSATVGGAGGFAAQQQSVPRANGGGGAGGYGGAGGSAGGGAAGAAGAASSGSGAAVLPAGHAVQQFWIPNDLVGPIIGKGGVKINEIRTQSQCTIRVTDPGTPAVPGGPVSPHERLVVLQGAQMNINVAVQLLHQRLEQEKQRKAMGM